LPPELDSLTDPLMRAAGVEIAKRVRTEDVHEVAGLAPDLVRVTSRCHAIVMMKATKDREPNDSGVAQTG
jgi:hypothetical protein